MVESETHTISALLSRFWKNDVKIVYQYATCMLFYYLSTSTFFELVKMIYIPREDILSVLAKVRSICLVQHPFVYINSIFIAFFFLPQVSIIAKQAGGILTSYVDNSGTAREMVQMGKWSAEVRLSYVHF